MTIISSQHILRNRLFFCAIVIVIAALFYWLTTSGFRNVLENTTLLREYIETLGQVGPLVIIVSMTLAIIMSPIPSAPIALVSGALYGHTWGTLYVLIGSTFGAVIAFLIARLLGFDFLERWFKGKLATNWVGSQNTLMGIVFFSRLMPFISFDIVSYAAGLTAITFWRFIVATIAGIAPASFILAHFGDELSSTDSQRIAFAILALGLFTAIPLLYKTIRKRRSN